MEAPEATLREEAEVTPASVATTLEGRLVAIALEGRPVLVTCHHRPVTELQYLQRNRHLPTEHLRSRALYLLGLEVAPLRHLHLSTEHREAVARLEEAMEALVGLALEAVAVLGVVPVLEEGHLSPTELQLQHLHLNMVHLHSAPPPALPAGLRLHMEHLHQLRLPNMVRLLPEVLVDTEALDLREDLGTRFRSPVT